MSFPGWLLDQIRTEIDALRTTVAQSSGGSAPDATTGSKGIVQLAGDLAGTATSPTVPGLAAKAPLASPTFTGAPAAPTAAGGTNTTQIASTAYVRGEIASLVNSAPGTMDTLGEIATLLAADESTATALATTVGTKAPLASPALTGNPTAPTQTAADNSTKIATTAYADTGLALKANLSSPTFTGTPAAPTPSAADNTTKLATTAFVQAAITALINGAPGALDTLKELADAINDDASYAATLTALLALKAPLASPTLTGTVTIPTATVGDSTTKAASTAFVQGTLSTRDILLQGAGLLCENFPLEFVTAQTVLATQVVYGALMGCRAGVAITGVTMATTAAGVGTAPTTFKIGIADSSGNILAVSANEASNAKLTTANSVFGLAFTAPYTPATNMALRAIVLEDGAFGTTAVQFARGASLQNAALSFPFNSAIRRFSTYGSGVTALAVAGTLGTAANTANTIWMGLY